MASVVFDSSLHENLILKSKGGKPLKLGKSPGLQDKQSIDAFDDDESPVARTPWAQLSATAVQDSIIWGNNIFSVASPPW